MIKRSTRAGLALCICLGLSQAAGAFATAIPGGLHMTPSGRAGESKGQPLNRPGARAAQQRRDAAKAADRERAVSRGLLIAALVGVILARHTRNKLLQDR